MSSAATRLSAKGQVVIPKQMRVARGWHPGLELIVEATDEGVLLRPRDAVRTHAAAALLGCARYNGLRRSLAEMGAAVAQGARSRR